MRAIVVVASKHGSTRGIAEEIATALSRAGILADVAAAGPPMTLDGYDAVVLGSAVYMGHWLPEARRFIVEHQRELAELPVWLFSSGPLGETPTGSVDQRHLDELLAETGARAHRLFAGRLCRGELNRKERLVTAVVRAPFGDYRDWQGIDAWAAEITASLAIPAPA